MTTNVYVNYINVLITPLPELWVSFSVHDYSNFKFIFSSHKKQPNIWCLSIKLPNDDRGSHIVCNSLQNAYAAQWRHEQIDGLIVGVHEKRAVLFEKKPLNLRIKTTLFFMLLICNPYKKRRFFSQEKKNWFSFFLSLIVFKLEDVFVMTR